MITELTDQQIAEIPKYRDKWLKIGLSTESGDKKVAWRAVRAVYRVVGLEAPLIQVWLDSPYHGVWGAYFLSQIEGQIEFQFKHGIGNQIWNQVGKQIWSQVEGQVWDQVRSQIRDWTRNQIENQIKSQIRDQIGDQIWVRNRTRNQIENQIKNQIKSQISDRVWKQIWNQIGHQAGYQVRKQIKYQIWTQIKDQIWTQIRDRVWDQAWNCGYGLQDASWLSFLDFFEMCGVREARKSAPLRKLSLHVGWWWSFQNLVLLTPKPSVLHINESGLHRHGGPALDYEGSWKIFALNGVRVPEWLAMQTSSELDPSRLFDIENAEIRREFVRKIGVERLCYSLGAREIDVWEAPIGGKYTLLELDVKGRVWKFLKMQNPSIDTWHVEGVPNECETVHQALNFRNGLTEAQIDDENGADWYQQGDVILRPKGVSKYKRLPVVLT